MKALTALFAIMALGFFIAGPMPLVTLGSAAEASAPSPVFLTSHRKAVALLLHSLLLSAAGAAAWGALIASANRTASSILRMTRVRFNHATKVAMKTMIPSARNRAETATSTVGLLKTQDQ